MKLAFDQRLIGDAPEAVEWRYLIGETFAGELCIVPLLEDLLKEAHPGPGFAAVILRQIDEEADHIRRYQQILGLDDQSPAGTAYAAEFTELTRSLPNITLKLYALQTLLESLSLGALDYRLKVLTSAPSRSHDQQIFADEEGHTRFGYRFLRQLREMDGIVLPEAFQDVSKRANRIFSSHFSGASIASLIKRNFSLSVDADAIDRGPAMAFFRKNSARIMASKKREFLSRYIDAVRT